jgi:N utilization substance protein B
MTRHEMRQNALLLIFMRNFNKGEADEMVAAAQECEMVEVNDQVLALFSGVEEKKDWLDTEISKYLVGWSTSRISKVSLSVLRIAMYEIFFCEDIDTDIAISEAVKLAQEYSLKDDVSFVNGVLSSVAKELKK